MPDLPLEIWSMIVSHLPNTQDPHAINHQADLCAVARINSDFNASASSKLYEHVQVVNFHRLLEGFDHTLSDKRRSKKHWLSTMKTMIAEFPCDDIFEHTDPFPTPEVTGHDHYNRLAKTMPRLSRDRRDSLDHGQTPDHQRWSLQSSPAPHICQTPCSKNNFQDEAQPPLNTALLHHYWQCNHQWSYYALGQYESADSIGTTGGEITTGVEEPADDQSDDGDFVAYDFLQEFSHRVIRGMQSEYAPAIDFKFRLYGAIDNDWSSDQCTCRVGFVELASGEGNYWGISFDIVDIVTLKVKFYPKQDRPTCPACGERQNRG